MKFYIKIGITLSVVAMSMTASASLAAASPSLGMASTFSILSSTYTNTASGTTLNGDLGYTTPPAVTPTVNGATHMADSVYNQAGIDQGTALAALNSQPCTFTFAPGAIDLASDTTHGATGVYAPGVYCISGAASIGGGGTITMSGSGTYIFRMTGALNTSASSVVALQSASACDIWWTPGAATTLGANSTFMGTDIDDAGITIGNQVTWTGKALAFGGTVSTTSDTITVGTCTTATPTPAPLPTATPAVTSTATPTPAAATSSTATPSVSASASPVPGLPNTGLYQSKASFPWPALLLGLLILSSVLYVIRKKSIPFSK